LCDVAPYTAQPNVEIDAKIAQKGDFRTETRYHRPLYHVEAYFVQSNINVLPAMMLDKA